MALKLKKLLFGSGDSFGVIQNNIALKLLGEIEVETECFGVIQNNIALKLIIQYCQ